MWMSIIKQPSFKSNKIKSNVEKKNSQLELFKYQDDVISSVVYQKKSSRIRTVISISCLVPFSNFLRTTSVGERLVAHV